MKKIILLICLLFSGVSWSAIPDLKLPFPSGVSWYLTRGYNTGTHIQYTNVDDRYALDFAGSGCNFVNSPVLATASGDILTAHDANDNVYGRYIIINHDGGYTSRYAHMNKIVVRSGHVEQGQKIGEVGNTGNVIGSCGGAHLHFVLYYDDTGGTSMKSGATPEPMSGYTGFTANSTTPYLSNNTIYEIGRDNNTNLYPSVLTTYNTYGKNVLGYPFDHGDGIYLHDWYGVLIQDFQHPDCPKGDCSNAPAGSQHVGKDGQTAIIYNPNMNQAFLVHDGFWRFYKTWIDPENKDFRPHGPILLGAPIDEEDDNWNGITRQSFDKGYLTWAPNVGVKIYDNNDVEIIHHGLSEDQTQVSNPVIRSDVPFNPRTSPIYKWYDTDDLAVVSPSNIAYNITDTNAFISYLQQFTCETLTVDSFRNFQKPDGSNVTNTTGGSDVYQSFIDSAYLHNIGLLSSSNRIWLPFAKGAYFREDVQVWISGIEDTIDGMSDSYRPIAQSEIDQGRRMLGIQQLQPVNCVNNPPILAIKGASVINLDIGEPYTEPGYTAKDSEDGDIAGSVSVSSDVDENTAGSYTVTYDVTDSGGASATQVTRNVNVKEKFESNTMTSHIPLSDINGNGYPEVMSAVEDAVSKFKLLILDVNTGEQIYAITPTTQP